MALRVVLAWFLTGIASAWAQGEASGSPDTKGVLPAAADVLEAVGVTPLRALLGEDAPTGAGVFVTQVEAVASDGRYMVNPDLYPGKEFLNATATDDTPNFHAWSVGERFYGSRSPAPGIPGVEVFAAGDWYNRTLLRNDQEGLGRPIRQTGKIQNHSWVAVSADEAGFQRAFRVLRLLDHVTERDGVLSVVSVLNGESEIPDLLSHSYNAICVGKSNGEHSSGKTLFDAGGRCKPDVVAPEYYTSFAAPLVAGTAALLVEGARRRGQEDAERPEVLKAMLMAGCTIEEFSDWSREWHTPLDSRFGAGELNAYNSWRIFDAGRAAATSVSEEPVGETGWDLGKVSGGRVVRYDINVPPGQMLHDLSVVLTWNRTVTDSDPGPWFEPEVSLPDLDLRLRGIGEPSAVIDESLSMNDNVEHIRWPSLPSGSYRLEVSSNAPTTADPKGFALAWRADSVSYPEIVDLVIVGDMIMATCQVTPGETYALQTTENFDYWITAETLKPTEAQVTIPFANDPNLSACRLVLESP